MFDVQSAWPLAPRPRGSGMDYAGALRGWAGAVEVSEAGAAAQVMRDAAAKIDRLTEALKLSRAYVETSCDDCDEAVKDLSVVDAALDND